MEALNDIASSNETSIGVRRAALFIHGVSEQDQRWLLERLSDAERRVLTPLLEELSQLGIPKEGFEISGDVLSGKALQVERKDSEARPSSISLSGVDRSFVVAEASETDQILFLEETSVLILRRALEDEPIELLACIFDLHPWKWRLIFVDHFDANRRFQLRERLDNKTLSVSSTLPNKFRSALLKALCARVQTLEMNAVIPELVDHKQEDEPSLFRRFLSFFVR